MRKGILFFVLIMVLLVSCSNNDEIIEEKNETNTVVMDIQGFWLSGETESIEFNEDGTFRMSSVIEEASESVSGIYEQDENLLVLHLFENDQITSSTPFLTFSRQYEGYRILYLMMLDGTFLIYTQEGEGEIEDPIEPAGVFVYSIQWDENSGLWSIMDFNTHKFSILYKGQGAEPSLKILDFYVDNNEIHYNGGCYTFEIFDYNGIQYLFALENGAPSTFYKYPSITGSSFQELFGSEDFAFIENIEAQKEEFDSICGVWTEEIHQSHEHDGETHEIGKIDKLVLREDNTFYRTIEYWDGENKETTFRTGTYITEDGLIWFESENGQEEMYTFFARQKEGYKVLYLMFDLGSFSHFTQKHEGTPEENPLLEGAFQSAPDWQNRDNEFFIVNFNDMKVYIYDFRVDEDGMFVPYLVQDFGRDGNHAYAIGMEGDFESFTFEGMEYAFGIFSNGFQMTMWKELEEPVDEIT